MTLVRKLTPAGIEIKKSKKNSEFVFTNARQLGAGAAEKLARDRMNIELIQFESANFLKKKTAAKRRLDT